MSSISPPSSSMLSSLNDETRGAIVRLNQKLIGLQAEIATKITTLDGSDDVDLITQKQHLSVLEDEIERALKSIDRVVTIALSTGLSQSEFLQHQDELNHVCELFNLNAEKMAQINEKL